MDARTAAELLYESEATLRMVDTALDELHLGEIDSESPAHGLWAMRAEDLPSGGDLQTPPEFCVRGFWQVHELLECVRQVREMMAPVRQQTELPLGEQSEDGRLDSVLSIVDALDSLDGPEDAGRAELVAELRQELATLLKGSPNSANEDLRVRAALSLLSEAEVRLTRLGHLFESGDHAA